MFGVFKRRGKKKGGKGEKKGNVNDPNAMEVDEEKDAEQIEDLEKKDHALETAQLKFLLNFEDQSMVENRPQVMEKFMENIKAQNMVEMYKIACDEKVVQLDSSLLSKMEQENKKLMKTLEEEKKDAEENHGEIEVMEILLEIATFKSLTASKQEALEAYDLVAALKSMSTGQLIDVVLRKILLGFVWTDTQLMKEEIEKAEKLMEKGGDWDRRNRLKVYRGMYLMLIRDFKGSSSDLLSALATFTTTELLSYEEFVFYTVIASIVALDRVEFKTKVIDSPEVLSVVPQIPHLREFMTSLHDCEYKNFFITLVKLNPKLCTDRYISTHTAWFFREVRVLSYAQFLQSYRSVTMGSMAKSFGVSIPFLDKELSGFISSRKINAQIDKVGQVIQTCQPNEQNARYVNVIRTGDVLLNRVQMLSRAINV